VRVGKSGHPRPWRTIKNESGIVIKDAGGATVSQMAYSGQGVGELKRKREAADLIISAVNARR
jgi:hypothetical protein